MGQTKKQRHEHSPPGQSRHAVPPQPSQWIGFATLGGVAAVLALSFASWRQIDQFNEGLDGRLGKIETRISQLADKVDNMPAQNQNQRRRGPDPNKVYQIKTAGSPAKGPPNAAVTIAEFSDFQ